MEYKDYYKIMGLGHTITQDDVKRAYRKLARKYHPDVSKEKDAEERFKQVGEAYRVLKDPEKRATYDHPGYHSNFNARVNTRGEDHHARLVVDLEDTFHGATRRVSLQIPALDMYGKMRLMKRTLNVNIPRGVKEGQQIRLQGQGLPGMGHGTRGDLYLEIHFKLHPLYRAHGRDLYMQLPLARWKAALGATVKTPTPYGTVDLKIPVGSSSGNKFRIKGRGISGNPPGDIYVTLRSS